MYFYTFLPIYNKLHVLCFPNFDKNTSLMFQIKRFSTVRVKVLL